MTDAREAVQLLASEFGIPTPPVIQGSGKRSRACWMRGARYVRHLSLSPTSWCGLEMATLHEFAHALRYARVGQHGHDHGFYAALKDTIRAWTGGDLRTYPWEKEYWTLWSYARTEGLTAAPHHRAAQPLHQAASAPAPAAVRIGQRVIWSSPKHGAQCGVVETAYAGCRARVKVATGQQFYVPQSWLRPEGASR